LHGELKIGKTKLEGQFCFLVEFGLVDDFVAMGHCKQTDLDSERWKITPSDFAR
jgi:hypothetical protein